MDAIRPEYLEALDAARWNSWWLLALLFPPVVYLFIAKCRWNQTDGLFVGFLVASLGCWLAIALAIHHYWEVKGQVALTSVEINDFTTDTARLFAPVLVGTPVAITYSLLWLAAVVLLPWFRDRAMKMYAASLVRRRSD